MRLRLSRRLFFAVALIVGPLLAYGVVMLVSDGLGLVRGDSTWIVVVGLAVPAAFAAGLGRIGGRSPNETVIGLVGSVAVTAILAVVLIIIWLSQLPPDFFN